MRDALGGVQSLLVLGGGSDIARATTHRLVASRCRKVVLAARRPEELEDELADLRGAGVTTAESIAFDARDVGSHGSVIEGAFDRFGDFDVVLLAFGVLGDQEKFEDDPVSAAEAVTVNYTGAVSSGLVAARRLRQQGQGTLVVMSSVAGERARRANFVYGSSKAGLDAFAQGLGDTLVGSGVKVLVVRPGFVHTKMTRGMEPAPLSTTPDAVADAIVTGIAQGDEVVWVPPTLRWVMAGMRHLPRPLWRRVATR